MAARLPSIRAQLRPMLKIERAAESGRVRLALSGRIQRLDLAELERSIAGESVGPAFITVDLEEVRLVDRDAIRFLVSCETAGIRLVRTPAYVLEWMASERDGAADEARGPQA